MRVVCWENVSNYHWEYYRKMEDVRNDVASHVLVKNPYLQPLAYQALSESIAVGEWHTLRLVHEGDRVRGAIDGKQLFDVRDDPFAGFGPTLRTGTIGIRCMWGSDMLFLDLKIWTKSDPY
jgi:hypothetical protein